MKKSNLFTLLVLLLVVILAASVLTTIGKDGDTDTPLPGGSGNGIGDGTGDGSGDGSQGGNNNGSQSGNNNGGDSTNTTCLHNGSIRTEKEASSNGSDHYIKTFCALCGEMIRETTEKHSNWFNNTCGVCGFLCKHATPYGGTHSYMKIDETYHTCNISCSNCGFSGSVKEEHFFYNGVQGCTCDLGNTGNTGNTSCTHVSKVTEYNKTETDHTAVVSCTLCSTVLESTTNVHTWSNGMCSTCNYSCTHNPVASSTSIDDAKHITRVVCSKCNYVMGNGEGYHSFNKRKCDCGYVCTCDINSEGAENIIESSDDGCASVWVCIHGIEVSRVSMEHDYRNGVCIWCQRKECTHDNGGYEVCVGVDEYEHETKSICSDCGQAYNIVKGEHNYVQGVCSYCQFFFNEGHPDCYECDPSDIIPDGYTWGDDGCYEKFLCEHGTIVHVGYIGPHNYENNRCTRCGHVSGAAG